MGWRARGGAERVRLRADARVAWKLTNSANLFADYGYANIASNIATYSYKQNRVMAGIEVAM